MPVVETPEMQPVVLDPLSQWIEDHKEELVALRDEVRGLVTDNRDDSRVNHLIAVLTGLNNLSL